MERLLLDLSINVTAMFRDPTFYPAFREKVVPLLRTYPFIRIWHAGCSTGEEVYSLAILLRRRGSTTARASTRPTSTRRCSQRAREGVFPLDRMQEYTENYIRAGGKRSFSEYYTAKYDGALFERVADARTSSSRSTTSSRTVVQRVQRHPLPQRADLLRPRAAEPRAPAVLRQPRDASASSRSATRSRSGSRRTRTATRSSTPTRSSTGRSKSMSAHELVVDRHVLGRARRALRDAPRRPAGGARRRRSWSCSTARRSRIRPRSATCSARSTPLKVCEVEDKEPIDAGHGLRRAARLPPARRARLARALDRRAGAVRRPSIDVLFESAAEAYGERCVGVVLTGANADGARGLARIAERGGAAIVQDPATAERAEMPRAALARGARRRRVAPVEEIAPLLVELCGLAKVTALTPCAVAPARRRPARRTSSRSRRSSSRSATSSSAPRRATRRCACCCNATTSR